MWEYNTAIKLFFFSWVRTQAPGLDPLARLWLCALGQAAVHTEAPSCLPSRRRCEGWQRNHALEPRFSNKGLMLPQRMSKWKGIWLPSIGPYPRSPNQPQIQVWHTAEKLEWDKGTRPPRPAPQTSVSRLPFKSPHSHWRQLCLLLTPTLWPHRAVIPQLL